MSTKICIALDAMGGDNSPETVIAGASLALQKNNNIYFNIYGNKDLVMPCIAKYKNLENNYSFFHTMQAISNNDKPADALRNGRESSMRLAINSVKEGTSHAIVSAGNTGALMAISKFVLKTIQDIDRPAICTMVPTKKNMCVLLDLGANAQCTPNQLLDFAVMGSAFSSAILNIEKPKVGLLNIGSEALKGNELVQQTAELISAHPQINYIGFAEGNDIFTGEFDVIVTDGFTGNVALKVLEGSAKYIMSEVKNLFTSSFFGKITAVLVLILRAFALKKFIKINDPRNYNGAMLIGLNGISVKSHGSADKKSYANAINVAYSLCKNNVNHKIQNILQNIKPH